MRTIVLAAVVAGLMAACGGGGGNPGTSGNGNGNGGGPEQVASLTVSVVTGPVDAPVTVMSISASERTARVQVRVKKADGSVGKHEVVQFSEEGSGLLVFSPASATALTDANGFAEIDVAAVNTNAQGATRVIATLDGATGFQNLQITGATNPGVDPQALVQSLDFVGVDPSDKSIVIAGAGGNGRSETAILRFKAVDASGSPLKDVMVDFAIIPAGLVQVNIPTAKTNNDGVVFTTVSSKVTPGAVIVKATVQGRPNLFTQSDRLTVTTGIVTQAGFDLSATKHNLNRTLSGDSSTVRIAIVDKHGNPVADGVPVVAVTDYGRIGTSARGGCTMLNGECSVDYMVQNPRPPAGQFATIYVFTQAGDGTEINDNIKLNVTAASEGDLYEQRSGGTAVGSIDLNGLLSGSCKATWDGYIGTAEGLAMPAATSVMLASSNAVVAASMTAGSPTLDDLTKRRTPVTLSFQLNEAKAPGMARLDFTLKSSTEEKKIIKTVSFPACTPA